MSQNEVQTKHWNSTTKCLKDQEIIFTESCCRFKDLSSLSLLISLGSSFCICFEWKMEWKRKEKRNTVNVYLAKRWNAILSETPEGCFSRESRATTLLNGSIGIFSLSLSLSLSQIDFLSFLRFTSSSLVYFAVPTPRGEATNIPPPPKQNLTIKSLAYQ